MLQIKTSINSPEELKKSLLELIQFISTQEQLKKHLEEYTFIYPEFGFVVDGEFKEYNIETEKLREEAQIEFDNDGNNYCFELPYFTSETLFFRRAASYKELRPLIAEYVDRIIQYAQSEKLLWSHDELPAGTDAIESLVFIDKKYIDKYIEFLRINDMDHEVHQNYGIGYIIKKHGLDEDTLRLVAMRLGECIGQHGDENVGMLLENTNLGEYLNEQKHAAQFLRLLAS